MGTDLYYFSGTGNSLHVARELQKRLPDARLVPMVGALKGDDIRARAQVVGLVFPVHALVVPFAVQEFLRRADLSPADYVFAVATRLGVQFRDFGRIDRLLGRHGRRLDARFLLNMGSNDVKWQGWRSPTEEDLRRWEAGLQERVPAICEAVTGRRIVRGPDAEYEIGVSSLLDRLVRLTTAYARRTGGANYFYTDERCSGCGVCERVCLSGKIALTDGRPSWDRRVFCWMCYACINFCPAGSIQVRDMPGFFKSYSKTNGRYPHPYASARDIAEQRWGDHTGSSLQNG